MFQKNLDVRNMFWLEGPHTQPWWWRCSLIQPKTKRPSYPTYLFWTHTSLPCLAYCTQEGRPSQTFGPLLYRVEVYQPCVKNLHEQVQRICGIALWLGMKKTRKQKSLICDDKNPHFHLSTHGLEVLTLHTTILENLVQKKGRDLLQINSS